MSSRRWLGGIWGLVLAVIGVASGLDTWQIPYQRNAVHMPGSRVSAPLSSCSDDFSTNDKDDCFTIEHDQRSGFSFLISIIVIIIVITIIIIIIVIIITIISFIFFHIIIIVHSTSLYQGLVNVTVNCCIWNELMFKKESVISANAFRCEVLVCEEKQSGIGVEIVSKHPVFTEGKQMSGCCLKDGIMYKPGAYFYDAATDTTLVCCSGSVYASLSPSSPAPQPPPSTPAPTPVPQPETTTKKSELFCPSYSCGNEDDFQCKVGRRVDKLKLKTTEYALFPSLITQPGFSMHMYGGRESLKRDCHGHYFFSSNVKLLDDKQDLSVKFLGLQRQHHTQGFLLKFTPGFRQAWTKMIDVDGGSNPLVKDIALDSKGFVFALVTYEKGPSAEKVIRVQVYDQCGEIVAGFDVRPGTFISRKAFLTIDSKDEIIVFHSYSENGDERSASPNPCHIAKVSGASLNNIIWEDVINMIDGESSCMPTGIMTDCEDNMYVTGFMASNRGFVRKYDQDGNILWTKADFQDQIKEVVYDPRENVLVVTMSTEQVVMVSSQGQIMKSINIMAREIALGEEGYFAFHFMAGEHKIGYLNKDLELIKNYDIAWQDWNSIAWCDNLVPNVYGTEVYLTCSYNEARDVVIFQTKLGEEKTYLGARADTES